jgi:hypothetical protein
MYAPSAGVGHQVCEGIVTDPEPRHRATQELIKKYVVKNFAPRRLEARPLRADAVFKGEDAVMRIPTLSSTS